MDPDTGVAKWLVDPGINGTHTKRPDGKEVKKFDRTQGGVGLLHYQGHPQPQAALGAGECWA